MTTTLKEVISSGVKLTPMMEQYIEIKKEHQDSLLFFRMGDFYELFFDDAYQASQILSITLTHRGKVGHFDIPMAGIPFHSANSYIDRITTRGIKVAICEQVEDPKLAKGIVKRKVVQVVGPSIPYDIEKSDGKEKRFLAATSFFQSRYFMVLLDFTTGEFLGGSYENETDFLEKLALFAPKEILLFHKQWDENSLLMKYCREAGLLITYLDKEYFKRDNGGVYLRKMVPSYEKDGVIIKNIPVLDPMSALAYYVTSTQSIDQMIHLRPFRFLSDEKNLQVSLSTLKGLEILPRSKENYKDSLLGFMDKTVSTMGARFLKEKFLHPLIDDKKLKKEHDYVEELSSDKEALFKVREVLSKVRDIERVLAKISSKKVTSQDLINLSITIEAYGELLNIATGPLLKKEILLKEKSTEKLKELSGKIRKFINDEIGASAEKGNLIKSGASNQRDKLSKLCHHSAQELAELELKYREKTKINNLKIKFNNVAGYFIEVSKSHLSKVPSSFERRQTLVNSERYTTDELNQFEKEIIHAQEKLQRLEKALFDEVVLEVSGSSSDLLDLANRLALIDVYQSFSTVAINSHFSRPTINRDKKILKVMGGRHPLIEAVIGKSFVPHHFELSQSCYFALITGPNMAGKTTVMREAAIIQFLAQIGSFVPAEKAELGICDYLFSRLGASDDIIRGQSTFMVEMAEMAEILRHATERSLVIVDEVGRGTSTYDGLAIAWSLLEYLVNKTKALTFFSTHYHELIDVVSELNVAKNYSVATALHKGNVEFLYRLEERGAMQSYGIYVAKLAGIPVEVLKRSEVLLKKLENHTRELDRNIPILRENEEVEGAIESRLIEEKWRALERDLKNINIMDITPIQAMEKLINIQDQFLVQ